MRHSNFFRSLVLIIIKAKIIFKEALDLYETVIKFSDERRRVKMRFHYKYFEPQVGDLIVDTHDGSTGIITAVGQWHYLSYDRTDGAHKRIVITVTMPEYNNYNEQFSLKCHNFDDYKTIVSEVKFISRDDLTLLDIEI